MDSGYSWKEWSQRIIHSLDQMDGDTKELEARVEHIHDDIIELKLKCKILWGVIGGLLGTLATLIILILAGVVR